MKQFTDSIRKFISENTGLEESQIEIEIPDSDLGDFAFPCFRLSKEMKKSPTEIANELADKFVANKLLADTKAVGPYLNFFADRKEFTKAVIGSIDNPEKKENKESIMIEYSNPNPFKGFHVGHLRNTVLGIAMVNILRESGFNVVPVNYYNDTGSHVSKCLWGIVYKYKKDIPENIDRGEWLGKVYTEANLQIADDESAKEQFKEIQRLIEDNDPEINKLREEGKSWSEEHFRNIYSELGAEFERIYYDSEVIDQGKEIVKELLDKGIAVEDEGAVIVDLKKYNLPTVVILRSDDTALYITKDFALAKLKFNEYNVDRSIYVVGTEQINHFKQLFKILELYGFRQAEKCYHLAYELVHLEEGKKMSSREGTVILYSDVRNQLLEKIKLEVDKRHQDWDDTRKQESVDAIFSSAIRFDMLKQEPKKVINFDIDKALDFEGETGPYVQYVYARICSIFRKVEEDTGNKVDVSGANYSLLTDPKEKKLVKVLSQFNSQLKESARNYKINNLCNYLIQLSQGFNEFYHGCNILKSEKELMKARLALADATRKTISKGLALLGIIAPVEM